MKKLFAILLALALLLAPALALGEEETDALIGDWYGEVGGLVLRLTLNGDGTYSAALLNSDDAATGDWVYDDGFVRLDGNLIPDLNVMDQVLYWTAMDAFLFRDLPETYVPAEPLTDAALDAFAGYWETTFVSLDGALLSPEDLADPVDFLFIDGTDVALGGSLFHDAVVAMTYENGALSLSRDGLALTLSLQSDGFLRLTLSTDPETVTLYLLPCYVQGLSPEPVGE